jgi:hypothetical protein
LNIEKHDGARHSVSIANYGREFRHVKAGEVPLECASDAERTLQPRLLTLIVMN